MENMDDSGKNGVMKLAPGFRFHPTDEELVLDYLWRKVFSCPLPSSIIPEIDLCNYDPWDLPGDSDGEMYFFNIKGVKCHRGDQNNKATHSGFWKAIGSEKQIVERRSDRVLVMKKGFHFYVGKPPNVSRTSWVMQEYSLLDAGTGAAIFSEIKNSTQNSMVQLGEWGLCRIFSKKRSTENGEMRKPSKKNKVKKNGLATEGLVDVHGPRKD